MELYTQNLFNFIDQCYPNKLNQKTPDFIRFQCAWKITLHHFKKEYKEQNLFQNIFKRNFQLKCCS